MGRAELVVVIVSAPPGGDGIRTCRPTRNEPLSATKWGRRGGEGPRRLLGNRRGIPRLTLTSPPPGAERSG